MLNFFPKTLHLAPRFLSLMSAKTETSRRIALYGILFSLLFFGVAAYRPALLTTLDNKIYDVMHGSLAGYGAPLPLIVDIDEKSLAEFGQWPWPRYHIAHLLKKLAAAGAASIGIDILFAEADRTSLKEVQRDLHEGLGIELNLEGIPDRLHDNDALLAEVLARGPYVMGYKFLASGDGKFLPGPIPVDIIILHDSANPGATAGLAGGKGIVAPLPVFAKVIRRSGFVNVRPDDDGIIRRIPLLMRFGDRIYPSLALAAVMQAVNAQKVFLKVSSLGTESLRVNNTFIPVDVFGNLLIRYRGKRKSFEYISAADLLNDRIDTKRIAGRVVFVGATAIGLKDTYATPLDSLYPGVEIHASVADNILHSVFFSRPAWAKAAELLATLCVGVLVSFVLAWARPMVCLAFSVCGIFILWFGGLEILKMENVFLSPTYPLISLGATFVFLSLLRFRLSEKQTLQITKEMERIDIELNLAREIQMGILPKVFPAFPEHDEFDIFADLIPAKAVGGDLYDFFFIDKDHLCFTLGDVADKGVPAALFMVITRTLVKNSAQFSPSPADMMSKINRVLCLDNPKTMFVTLIIGILNVHTGEVLYASGGHNRPILIRHAGKVQYMKDVSGPALGVLPEAAYKKISLTLGADDAIFLYTDGVTEAMNEKGEFFRDKRLLEEIKAFQHASVKEMIVGILQEVRKHTGSRPQSDDIAMMMIRYRKNKKEITP
jgi:serine phosphatase RsbU (regulator of sigma subunit)/CHASE2 domain-containing sensor protein